MMKLHTPDLTAQNIEKLAALFPNCITETTDAKGKLKRGLDFDQLRQELSDHVVEGPRERYHLDWPGKREALLAANAPIAKTLRPCREESVDFDTTKNLFIEGDNLDALKLLQETYLGKVKLIYIDPPYNTGKDFLYEDDFGASTGDYLKKSNQVEDGGLRLVANTEANGRFHSDWLSMIYPRLKIASSLLSDDGAIFISIDDGEVANLRRVCDEIFGEDNFVANVIWQKKYAVSSDAKGIPPLHDHILVYQKDKAFKPNMLPRTEKQDAIYKNPDNDPRGLWRPDNLTRNEYRERDCYPITSPKTGRVFMPPKGASWRHPKHEVERMIADNRIWFGLDGNSRPAPKRFLTEVRQGVVASAWWPFSEVGHNDESKKELLKLFDGESPFDTPKPTRLIGRMLQLATNAASQDVILYFFCGSGTTADAVLQANAIDAGNRKFIAVQLPEPIVDGPYQTIAEVSKERIRRAGAKIKAENATTAPSLDIGFRVLKIDTSNMKDVYYAPDEVKQGQLEMLTDNIKEDRTPEDLLFQVLVDWGVDLALPITQETIAKKKVFFVDGNALAACFDPNITEELVKELAKKKPLRAVFRDSSYGSDSVKINVEQIFKLLSPGTELKSL